MEDKDVLIQMLRDLIENARNEQINAEDLRTTQIRAAYLEGYINGIETCIKKLEVDPLAKLLKEHELKVKKINEEFEKKGKK